MFIRQISRATCLRNKKFPLPAPFACLTPRVLSTCPTSTISRPLGVGRRLASLSLTRWPRSSGLGCVAYRDEKGSDFIQTLVEVLRATPEGDLLELLMEVCWGMGVGIRGERPDSSFLALVS